MILAIYFYNNKGDILYSRIFRDEIGNVHADSFRVSVLHSRNKCSNLCNEKDNYEGTKSVGLQKGISRKPINSIGDASYFHVVLDGGTIWLVAISNKNPNALMIFEVLYKIKYVIENLFGKINEERIRANFVSIHHIIEEMCDYGYPQKTDFVLLKSFLNIEAIKSKEDQAVITSQVTGQIGWRKDGIKYRNNELFLDVSECVSLLMSTQGQVLSACIVGKVVMKSQLSGMPDCKLGLNDAVQLKSFIDKGLSKPLSTSNKGKLMIVLDDCSFHQCVRLGNFDSSRSINFIPPDGSFELLKYRTTTNVFLPIRIISAFNNDSNSISYQGVLKCDCEAGKYVEKIVAKIPLSNSSAKVNIKVNKGFAKWKPDENCIIWKIKRIMGTTDAQMNATVELFNSGLNNKKSISNPIISLEFQVGMACSGLRIRYVKIIEPKLNYNDSNVIKWVRYQTFADGDYVTRL